MTARYQWDVKVCPDFDDVYVSLQSVQSIQMAYGKRLDSDSLKGSTITVSGRDPNLLPTLVQGTYAKLETTGFSYQCYLADIQIDYGFVPQEDRWTIVFEDALGVAAKINKTKSITSNQQTVFAIGNLGFPEGPAPDALIGFGPDANGVARMSAISITNGNLLSAYNQIMNTEQGLLYGGATSGVSFTKRLFFLNRNRRRGPEAEFTDSTPQAPAIAATFDGITFAGLQQTYWDKVIVEPEGLAPQTAGTGATTYVIDTYDVTIGQAAQTAQFILDNSSPDTSGPVELTCLAENQTNDAALDVAEVGRAMNIKLRTDEYTCEVLGGVISANPESTRFTYYLKLREGSSFNFTLDSIYYGVLDTDKLG
jgi:hypothetical protein